VWVWAARSAARGVSGRRGRHDGDGDGSVPSLSLAGAGGWAGHDAAGLASSEERALCRLLRRALFGAANHCSFHCQCTTYNECWLCHIHLLSISSVET
jgi:hypothetical protein